MASKKTTPTPTTRAPAAKVERDRLPKGAASQIGSTLARGTQLIQQWITPYNVAKLLEYERAVATDETVGTGVEFIRLALIASIQQYHHPDRYIQDFVRANLDEMTGTTEYAIGELCWSGLVYGYGASEIMWRLDSGRVMLEELVNYHPASLMIVPDVHGRLLDGAPLNNPYYTPPAGITSCGIWQMGLDGSQYIHLPKNKVCLVTHHKKSGLYTGESAIKRIYKNWKLKDVVLEQYATALDRYGTPIAYAIVPAGVTPDMVLDENTGKPRNMTIREAAERALGGIHQGTALVFQRPSPQDDIDVGTLTTGNNFGSVFLDKLEYLNKAIFRGLLIPQLLLETGAGGGLSNPGQVHWEVFKLMIQGVAREIVRPFEEQVIGRMIRLNFDDTRPGYFEVDPFDASATALLSQVFEKFVKTGVIDPSDKADLDRIREMYRLPARESGTVVSSGDHQRLLLAPADKVASDRIKAQAAFIKARGASVQHEATGRKHDLASKQLDLETTRADREHERGERDLDLRERDQRLREQVDRKKLAQDHELKLMQAEQTHQQAMLALRKGLVSQPAPTAPNAQAPKDPQDPKEKSR